MLFPGWPAQPPKLFKRQWKHRMAKNIILSWLKEDEWLFLWGGEGATKQNFRFFVCNQLQSVSIIKVESVKMRQTLTAIQSKITSDWKQLNSTTHCSVKWRWFVHVTWLNAGLGGGGSYGNRHCDLMSFLSSGCGLIWLVVPRPTSENVPFLFMAELRPTKKTCCCIDDCIMAY